MKKEFPLIVALTTSLLAGKMDSAVKAFESAPGYVAPIATILGTFGSSGWNHQSSIGKNFSGSLSIPVNFLVISEKDRTYTETFVDSTLLLSNLTPDQLASRLTISFDTPTIFGKNAAPTQRSSNLTVDGDVAGTTPVYYSDGVPNVAGFNWLPLPTLQAEFSAFYTSFKFRYLGKPGQVLGIHFPGVGIQHDLQSFLPELPVNLTLFGNFSFPILNWRPGENIDGTLEMRGRSVFTGITVGKDIAHNKLDMMLEAGWEHSTLKTGGTLVINPTTSKDKIDTVTSNMSLEGRNKFRAGVVIAFNPGKHYRISGGIDGGAEATFMVNPIAFRFGDQPNRTKKVSNPPNSLVESTKSEPKTTETVPADSLIPAEPVKNSTIDTTTTTLPEEIL